MSGVFYNQNGVKQFDIDQLPLLLKQKVTLDVSLDVNPRTMGGNSGSSVVVWNTQTINVSSSVVCLAIAGTTPCRVSYFSNGTYGITYLRQSSGSVEVYVFGYGSVGSSNSGVDFYNSSGTRLLSGDDLPMRVIDSYQYATADQNYAPISINTNVSKVAAVLTSSAQTRWTENASDTAGNIYVGQTMLSTNGGVVSVSNIPYVTLRTTPQPDSEPKALNSGLLVAVDVSGF